MAGDLETYRTKDEIDYHRQHEPLVVLRQKLLDRGVEEEEIKAIEQETEQQVADIVEFAENSPWPDVAEAYTDVYK
jgi:pyruvate dehydrogenase E1 component alpha subunit